MAVAHMSFVAPDLNREIIQYIESSENPSDRYENMDNFRDLEILKLFNMCRRVFDYESFLEWEASCEGQTEMVFELEDGNVMKSRIEWVDEEELAPERENGEGEESKTTEQGEGESEAPVQGEGDEVEEDFLGLVFKFRRTRI